MKKWSLLLVSLFIFNNFLQSQDYLGLSSGNYSGITGLQLQPANVADNRFQFDLNLFSTSVNFDNNYLGFSRSYFINNRFSFQGFDSYDDFKKKVLIENDIKDQLVYFNIQNRIQAPLSFLLTTGPKSGIGFSIQSRTSISVRDMDKDFAKQAYEFWKYAPTQGQYYDVSGLKLNALNWIEAGLTYGRVLYEQNKHFVKFGITAKYLGGISSWNLDANDLHIKADKDSFLSAYGSDVRYSRSNSDISTKINSSYRPDANSWGGDIGFVYEFRGRINKFKFAKYDKDEDYVKTKLRRDKNKYTLKVGVSLLDVGVLHFTSAPLARNFAINTMNYNMNQLDVRNIKQFDTLIAKHVNYTGAINQTYSVAMPTALSAQVDLHLLNGFYVNAMAYMPFNLLNKNTDYRVVTPHFYAVTPRWESRIAGVYVPISLNSHNQMSAGATLRLGPVFVGTSNLLTLIKKDNIQYADVHAGFKIPLAFGKPSKAANWLKKFTNEKEEDNEIQYQSEKPKAQPIQIIINNYNYPKDNGMNRSSGTEYKVNSGSDENVIIETNEIDVKEINDLQYQIEYLKNKLNQKEQFIDELEKNNKSGNNNDSKKKIDSLRAVYLYDTTFQNKLVDFNNSSLEAQKIKYQELSNALIELDAKEKKLNKRTEALSQSVENQIIVSKNNGEVAKTQSLISLQKEIAFIQPKPVNQTNPLHRVYHAQIHPEKIESGISTITSPFPYIESSPNAQLSSSDILSQKKPTEINKKLSQPKLNQEITPLNKINQDQLMTKKEADKINNELISLRNEVVALRSSSNQNKPTIVNNRWIFGRRKKEITKVIIDTTYTGRASNNIVTSTPQVVIKHDTIYVEKIVEKTVDRIVRDTIVNTIQHNNVITKIEEKTVVKDNEKELILKAEPEFVLFDVGSFMIKNIYFNRLISIAQKIKKYPDLKVSIIGHTDNTGNAIKNQKLSQDRADAVRVYLIKRGLQKEQIQIEGVGSDQPLTENTTAVGKSQNRRVDVKIIE